MLLLLAARMGSAWAAEPLRTVSRQEYATEVGRLVGAVEACQQRAENCNAKAVPADERVDAGEGKSYQVHWGWLRDALGKGAHGQDQARARTLKSAKDRLLRDQDAVTEDGSDDGGAAVRKAQEVLGRAEFRTVVADSWWQQKLAIALQWLDGFFGKAVRAVPWAPWMTVLVEWGLLAAAIAGLGVWVLRVQRQQRMGIAMERGPAATSQVESENWAARAETEAAAENWRDAVHCLYWSAIVMLEGQKFWRQNRARTPREHVNLLAAGSEKRATLGGLTTVFERIWYGERAATSGDYDQARALLDRLRVSG